MTATIYSRQAPAAFRPFACHLDLSLDIEDVLHRGTEEKVASAHAPEHFSNKERKGDLVGLVLSWVALGFLDGGHDW